MPVAMKIGWLLAGAFIGFTLATWALFPQIQNREAAGRSQGFTRGANHVVTFLRRNMGDLPADAMALGPVLRLNGSRLTLVELNGVKTIRVEDD